jgi:hypothetical protein
LVGRRPTPAASHCATVRPAHQQTWQPGDDRSAGHASSVPNTYMLRCCSDSTAGAQGWRNKIDYQTVGVRCWARSAAAASTHRPCEQTDCLCWAVAERALARSPLAPPRCTARSPGRGCKRSRRPAARRGRCALRGRTFSTVNTSLGAEEGGGAERGGVHGWRARHGGWWFQPKAAIARAERKGGGASVGEASTQQQQQHRSAHKHAKRSRQKLKQRQQPCPTDSLAACSSGCCPPRTGRSAPR